MSTVTDSVLPDRALLEALGSLTPQPVPVTLWRVTQEGRNPCSGSRSFGRWNSSRSEVLYTSETCMGAIAEMRFHASRDLSSMGAGRRYRLHELRVMAAGMLDLTDRQLLTTLGTDMRLFGHLHYRHRHREYRQCRPIGDTAARLDITALRVPSARRASTHNVVLLTDRIRSAHIRLRRNHGVINCH